VNINIAISIFNYMKIKHIWSVLCQDSILNQDDNIISLNKVFEQLSVNLTPTQNLTSNQLPDKINLPINYEITSFWLKDEKILSTKGEVKYALFNPKNDKLLETIQNIEIPSSSRRFRSRMKISGMPIAGEGYYRFEVSIKEEGEKIFRFVSELPFEVNIKIEKPQATHKPPGKN